MLVGMSIHGSTSARSFPLLPIMRTDFTEEKGNCCVWPLNQVRNWQGSGLQSTAICVAVVGSASIGRTPSDRETPADMSRRLSIASKLGGHGSEAFREAERMRLALRIRQADAAPFPAVSRLVWLIPGGSAIF